MSIISWENAETRHRKEGFIKIYVDEKIGARKLRMHLSVLGPYKRPHKPHRHEGEEIFFILEGEGEVKIEDEEFKVGPMTAIYIPSNLLHGIENAGEKVLKYLVIVAK